MSHVSNELKWPRMAYGQQCALFWAIVQNIKKLFTARPIEQTCNRNPPHSSLNVTSQVDCYCHRVVGGEGVGWGRETVGGWEITSFIELGSTSGQIEVRISWHADT